MYFVYILQSTIRPDKLYVGQSNNLENRLRRHNLGQVTSTKTLKPWKIMWYTHKQTRAEAMKLEKYLKTLTYKKKLSFMDKYK